MLFSLLFLLLAALDVSHSSEAVVADSCRFDAAMAVSKTIDELISEDDPMRGNPDADVVLVEFFDPNCIHCRALEPVMDEVMGAYEDRVRYYKKPFALNEHSLTQIGAMLIAADEGKFYEMAGRQLTSPHFPYLSNEELVAIAEGLGMDGDAFYEDLIEGAYLNRVQFLRNQARQAGVRGTPTLLINDPQQVLASDSRSVECIRSLIDDELRG